jgi:GNAT superfamily N-acetyltransferase
MVPDDARFVAASWFESYWKLHASKSRLAFMDYKEGQDARIRTLMARSVVRVVYATAIPDEIVAYGVFEPDKSTAHWVYVKSAYRHEGIATALLKNRYKWYTHASGKAGDKLAEKLGLVFNPYLLER